MSSLSGDRVLLRFSSRTCKQFHLRSGSYPSSDPGLIRARQGLTRRSASFRLDRTAARVDSIHYYIINRNYPPFHYDLKFGDCSRQAKREKDRLTDSGLTWLTSILVIGTPFVIVEICTFCCDILSLRYLHMM